MARDNFLHFRVDDSLMARVDEIADRTKNGNRSQVCRLLLAQALGDDLAVAAIEEALYEYSAIRKRVTAKLALEMSERLPAILDAETKALRDEA